MVNVSHVPSVKNAYTLAFQQLPAIVRRCVQLGSTKMEMTSVSSRFAINARQVIRAQILRKLPFPVHLELIKQHPVLEDAPHVQLGVLVPILTQLPTHAHLAIRP